MIGAAIQRFFDAFDAYLEAMVTPVQSEAEIINDLRKRLDAVTRQLWDDQFAVPVRLWLKASA